MGLFSRNKTPQAVEPIAQEEEKKPQVVAQPAELFTTLRTTAYLNKNDVAHFLQLWVAIKEEGDEDKWRVMRYYVFKDAKDANGNGAIQSENASSGKEILNFIEALSILGQAEYNARKSSYMEKIGDVQSLYPREQFPFLDNHYHEVTHFVDGANAEGIAFDDLYRPHKKVRGMIVANDADFDHDQFGTPKNIHTSPAALARIEGGVIRDVFAAAADKKNKFEDNLRALTLLKHMDEFAFQAAVFYASVQNALGLTDGLNNIRGMTPQFKKDMSNKVNLVAVSDLDSILTGVIPKMAEAIETCKSQETKAHTEPFEKFLAECQLYTHLLKADQAYRPLKSAALTPGGIDENALAQVRENVETAEKQFIALGGSKEMAIALKGWIHSKDKQVMPKSFTEFLSRYYEARDKAMKKFADKGFAPEADMAKVTESAKPSLVTERRQASGGPTATG